MTATARPSVRQAAARASPAGPSPTTATSRSGPVRGAHRRVSRDASRSASISVGRYVLAQGMSGKTDASATCSAS